MTQRLLSGITLTLFNLVSLVLCHTTAASSPSVSWILCHLVFYPIVRFGKDRRLADADVKKGLVFKERYIVL